MQKSSPLGWLWALFITGTGFYLVALAVLYPNRIVIEQSSSDLMLVGGTGVFCVLIGILSFRKMIRR